MYCVVQEVEKRKENKNGAYKEIEVYTWSKNNGKREYNYCFGTERFERPIKKAYKINIHNSKREQGKVIKRQFYVRTVDYYDLIDYGIFEYINDVKDKLEYIAESLNVGVEDIEELIYTKVNPIQERIQKEFEQTEEYKTTVKYQEIIRKHNENKKKFEAVYGSDTYDYCYNVFGELMNADYLEELKERKRQKESGYQKQKESNYSNFDYNRYFSGYRNNKSGGYTENEKIYLKKIYKAVSREFHPDNPKGDNDIMKFINDKLKIEWGI